MFLLITAVFAGSADVCTAWDVLGERFTLDDVPVVESSGLVVGTVDPSVLYTIEDAGSDPLLQLLAADGAYVGQQLIRGATNTDWEDLANGPCPAVIDAARCLYIGDIGDNDETRASVTVWVVAESTQGAESAAACTLSYGDAGAQDAEAMFVDPEGNIRIITKSGTGTPSVYLRESPACDGSTESMVEEAELTLSGTAEEDREVTGATLSSDGTLLVLRSSTQAWVWRGCQRDWANPSQVLDLASEPQGEAIALDADGNLFTTSEGTPLRLRAMPCEAREALSCPECGCGHASPFSALLPGMFLLIPIIRSARRSAEGAPPV